VHILHEFTHDFYNYPMKVIILGYIRPELDYTSRGRGDILCIAMHTSDRPAEDLIEDIETDKKVGLRSLERPAYSAYQSDLFF
jgi:riboflavin kinase